MYPKLKARGEEKEVSVAAQDEDKSALLFREFDSLSLEDHLSPGNERGDDSPPHARIPKSYVPLMPMPSIAVSKGRSSQQKAKAIKEIDVDYITNIRASPIPRPRAVLSSPDNDGMIGNRNKLPRERQSVLKTQTCNSSPATIAQRKTILKKDSPTITRRIPTGSDSKTPINEKLLKEPRVSQQKPTLKKSKPTPEWT